MINLLRPTSHIESHGPRKPTHVHSSLTIQIIQVFSEDVPSKAITQNSHVLFTTPLLLNVPHAILDINLSTENVLKTHAQLVTIKNMVNVFKTQQDVIHTTILPNVFNAQLDILYPMVLAQELHWPAQEEPSSTAQPGLAIKSMINAKLGTQTENVWLVSATLIRS